MDYFENNSAFVFTAGFVAIASFVFAFLRGNALMMFFQQEEYDNTRFINWYSEKRAYDRMASKILAISAILYALVALQVIPLFSPGVPGGSWIPLIVVILGFGFGMRRSLATVKENKKPLVVTERVKRIRQVYLLLALAVILLVCVISAFAPRGAHYTFTLVADSRPFSESGFSADDYDWRMAFLAFLLILFIQSLPFLLLLANILLAPFEARVKEKFRTEAVEKFNTLKPTVIAITGSFGKTSTKHILSHIMNAAAPTLATPGSVNTEMGITRIIREQLTAEHTYFIVEMGAYGPGSIARLCRLTPPNVALVTAVGAAHYERFKTLETVARAKFEIAEAVFANNGRAVVSTDGIPTDLLAERTSAVQGPYVRVGATGDIVLTHYDVTPAGLAVTVKDGDETHVLKAPLFGTHQAGNIAMAAATARAIGLPWSAIKGALATTPQIRFRLEVSNTAGSPAIINDAYNSNPIGFAGALECLDVLVKEGGRRILVTPGMVELGDLHASEHERLGALTAQHCDIVCIVTPERIPSFQKGLEAANDGSVTVMTFTKQADAEAWVRANWKAEDAVLFENNLPDLYEADVRF